MQWQEVGRIMSKHCKSIFNIKPPVNAGGFFIRYLQLLYILHQELVFPAFQTVCFLQKYHAHKRSPHLKAIQSIPENTSIVHYSR